MDPKRARERLEEERARLERVRASVELKDVEDRAAGSGVSELSPADQHPAEAGTETFERARDVSILQGIDAQLAEIERAQRRIEDGTYGTCEVCGRPIGDERLEAKPAARLCVDDQARLERGA